MNTTLRRVATLLAAPGLALTLVAAPAVTAPAQAAPALAYDDAPGTSGAAWLSGQLADGLLTYPTEFGSFTDYGLSIDAGLGLAGLGGHDATVGTISDAVAAGLESYISGEGFGDPGSTYAGPAGKALVMAQTAGDDPTTYGGGNLVERVESVVSTDPVILGRIVDQSAFGDFANVLGQAFAVQGLSQAGSARAADATAFLLKQQCADGYFRLGLTGDKAAVDQTCDGGTAADSAPDTDATALVMLALENQSTDPVVAAAMTRAEAWLLDQQRNNGAFGGGPSTEAPNTNSTGIAGWALGNRGHVEAAEAAAIWVRRHQAVNVGDCAPFPSADLGAVAYDGAALDAGRTDGITDASIGQWLRASTQALPVLRWAPDAEGETHVIGGAGYVRAGTKASVGVLGAAPGAALCATRGATEVQRSANADGEAELRIELPGGTAVRTVQVFDDAGAVGTVELHALGKLTVPFRLKDTVDKGDRQVVRVRGLAPAESVTVLFRGDRVDAGQANGEGRFTARFPVTGKLGTAKVKVFGEFRDIRRNAKTFTVTR